MSIINFVSDATNKVLSGYKGITTAYDTLHFSHFAELCMHNSNIPCFRCFLFGNFLTAPFSGHHPIFKF